MCSFAFLTCLMLVFQAIRVDYVKSEDSNLKPTISQTHGGSPFKRVYREVDNEMSSGSSGEGSCSSSTEVDLFSPFADSLDMAAGDCSGSGLGTHFTYSVEYEATGGSTVSFNTETQDESVLFADHFSTEETYKINARATCGSCDLSEYDLTLDITVRAYSERLFPHGSLMSDEQLTGVDDDYVGVHIDTPFSVPFFDKRHQRLYMNSNGLVSFEKPNNNWYPAPFPYGKTCIPTLAVYWTDLDLSDSSLYYSTYHSSESKRAQNLLILCSTRVGEYAETDFTGQWMLVGTWSDVQLYSSESQNEKKLTIQVVLISDFSSSYVLYLYSDFSIDRLNTALTIGYSAADFKTYYNVEFNSSDSYLNMDAETGNTGETGQWMFNLTASSSSDNEAEVKCAKWAGKQNSTSWTEGLPSCPCSKQQANRDWRYSFAQSKRSSCAIYIPAIGQSTVECCFDEQGALATGSVNGGSYLSHHPVFHPDDYKLTDSDPYAFCCEQSDNCEVFRLHRPSADCSMYVAPDTSFGWGDPHFETFDGTSYTFNGVGEFVLLSSSTNSLDIQVRLEQYQSNKASVITAVAIKHKKSPVIQFEATAGPSFLLYLDSKNRSDILPDEGELLVIADAAVYDSSSLADVDLENVNNVFILNDNNTYLMSTSSGVVMKVGLELSFLYYVLEVGSEFLQGTEGLVGFYDKDPTNDFRLPNGTTASKDLTEEKLYTGFGLKWHVEETDSIFFYHDSMQYSDYNSQTLSFTPSFGTDRLNDNPTLKAQAEAQCDGDYSCLYDTAQTEDLSVGLATYEIRNFSKRIEDELDNLPPNITGSSFSLIVTTGTQLVATYTASDPDTGTSTEITIREPAPEGVELNATGHLLLNISSLPSLSLYLTSSDSNDTTTSRQVTILLCDCKNNGTCIKDPTFLPLNSNGHYRLPCECGLGFGGEYCESDLRGCGQHPCPSFTTCETDSSSDGGYQCVDCESGYQYNSEDKCVDIDECVADTDSCSQTCTNTDGSYQCSCNSGYRLDDDGFTCNDIDECTESSDECDQECTNDVGGYSCGCINFWDLSIDGTTCDKQGDCGGICEGLCSTDGITPSCSCPHGKKPVGSDCIECDDGKYGFQCTQTCDCTNGGTCTALGCDCAAGYKGYDCGTEINTFSPVFSSNNVESVQLPEALPKDTPFLYLEATDKDVGAVGEVTYAIVTPSYDLPSNLSNGTGVFTINATSGLLSTTTPLASQVEKEYLLEVEARDGASDPKKATHLLYIEVVTAPLPQPVFSSSSYQESLYENKTKGAEVLTDLSCSEEDSINEKLVNLRIEIVSGNVNSTFEVVNNKIQTAVSLDYETVKIFNLQLSCTNSFNNTALTNATVLLLNINDNLFEFEESSYSVETFENATSGALLTTLLASDADHPDSRVEYFFKVNKFADIFKLNKTSGRLSVATANPFDREERDNYTMEVEAYLFDNDNSIQHTISTDITVTIKDVNDFTPHFDQSLYVLTNLSQSNEFGDTVLFVSAVDKDLGANGEFVFSIQNNAHFTIDPQTGEVSVNTTFLDRGTYVLSIYATDSGNPPLIGKSVIDIYVKPTPNEIYFTKYKYVFNVSEGGGLGMLVGKVEATLFDVVNVSIDSELEYSFIDDSSASLPFFLDSESGEIIVYSSLDYEDQDDYEFQISASFPDDLSVPSSTTLVEVVITDSNDNSPIFSPSSYSELVYDDIEMGSIIVTVHASDEDHNGYQPITYTIEEDFNGPFEINSTSGDIFVSSGLGLPQDYHFTVTATDSGEPLLSAQAVVYVSVARRSAIHPLLSSAKFVFDMLESVDTAGVSVGTVTALIDGNITVTVDHGMGFRLKDPGYDPSVSIPFKIDDASGEVTTVAHLFDYEQQEVFVFYVELYDLSDLTKVYDTAPVVVKLLDVNDKEPSFQQKFYSGFVSETAKSSTTVLKVSASDLDSGKNSELLYTLTSPDLGFHIDPHNGDVTLVNSTQVPGNYKMTVTATDQGNPQKSATVNLDIVIIPDSQNISFPLANYSFSVPEGSSIGTVLGDIDVMAVNGDTFTYDGLTFELSPVNDCIGNDGRSIKVTCNVLDREEQAVYALSMKVTDSTQGATGVVGIQVDVEDTNDIHPLFERDVYATVISNDYNVTVDGAVVSPAVTDSDANSMTTFTIQTSNTLISELFLVNPSTGEVTLTDTPPVGDYSFQITASDSSLSTSATVLVSVFEPGPKTLEFTYSSLSHSVPENSPGGTEIGGLELLAPGPVDPADYIGNLKFAVLSGNGANYFHVFDHNGSLTLLNDFLDREKADSHVILVEATFKDYKLSAKAYVTIEVTDKNDNAPKFTKNVYSTSIPSDSDVGTSVVTVNAKDSDIGINANVSYSFLNKSESNFDIDNVSGQVTTSAALDADTHYKLTVVAADGGSPQLTSTCIVSVFAEIPRPESISFVLTTYEFLFTENNDPGSHVGIVSIAEDTQFLEGLAFSFVTPSDTEVAADLELFHLDAASGNISALSSIDREEVDGIEVTVKAQVPSEPSLSASTVVKIIIVDENDHTPTFEKSIYTDATLTEGSISTKQTILTVTAVDKDKDENGDVEYELSDKGDSSHFTIGSTSGNIKASSAGLKSGYYHITVIASDGGSPSLTGTAEVLITVYALLPDGIAFEKDTFAFSVPEDTTPGTVISDTSLKLKLIDLEFVTIFEYTTNNEGFILVGNNTKPTLYSSFSFDYDTDPNSYDIIVTATVHLMGASVNIASATATVTINLVDVNDNSPVFEDLPANGKYDASVVEETNENIEVISLSASDLDSGSYGSIKFNLVDTFGGRFKIFDNGLVVTGSTSIDREENPEFLLIVEARDGGNPPHTNTALVHVVVLDINDEYPELISGNSYHVLEEQPPNIVLFTVIAVDRDEGGNGKVTYAAVGGDVGYFGINSLSGEVHSKVKLDYEESGQKNIYNLTLSLKDGGEPPNPVTKEITINVINVPNDHRPYFGTLKAAVVSNNAKPDTSIIQINAGDYDGDGLTFEVNRTEFKIDNQKVLRKANDEVLNIGKIPVLVRVTDDSQYSLSAETAITITVVSTIIQPSTSHVRTTTSSLIASSNPATTVPQSGGGGGTGFIGFGMAGVFIVLFILAIVVIVALVVLNVRKRRERVEEKDRDPYAQAEENWVLKDQPNSGDKKPKKPGKKAKGKKEHIELERKDSLVDSSAYETMYEDDFADLQNMPWMDQNYQADSEDNRSEFTSSAFSNILTKGKRPPSTGSSIDERGRIPPSLIGLSKPTLSRPGNAPSKRPASKPAGSTTTPSLSKPAQTKPGPPSLTKPTPPKPNPLPSKPTLSKPASTAASTTKPNLTKLSATKSPPKTAAAKSSTTSKPSSSISSTPSKPAATKSTSSNVPRATSTSKKTDSSTKANVKPEGNKPLKKKGTASSKPASKQTTPSVISPLMSSQDGLEGGETGRKKKRASISSSTSDLDTDDYLSAAYGNAAPMKSGERPSEYDIFVNPDSSKPPAGTRKSLQDIGFRS